MKKVSMSKGEFVKEHKHLVNVLEKGSRGSQKREAAKQKGELSEKR